MKEADLQSLSSQEQGEASLSEALVFLMQFCQFVDVANIELLLLNLTVEILQSHITKMDAPLPGC